MAFTAIVMVFSHLNIVGCLLKRRPTKGRSSRAPQDPPSPPPAPQLRAACFGFEIGDQDIGEPAVTPSIKNFNEYPLPLPPGNTRQ